MKENMIFIILAYVIIYLIADRRLKEGLIKNPKFRDGWEWILIVILMSFLIPLTIAVILIMEHYK